MKNSLLKNRNDLPLDEPETFRFRGRKKKKRKSGWVIREQGYWWKNYFRDDEIYVARTFEEAQDYLERHKRKHPWMTKDKFKFQIYYRD